MALFISGDRLSGNVPSTALEVFLATVFSLLAQVSPDPPLPPFSPSAGGQSAGHHEHWWVGMAGLRGVGGMGGRERGKGGASGWSLPPSPYLSIHWGRNILDVQGHPPLAERAGGKWWRLWDRTIGKCMGGPIHYGFCAGHSPSPLLGRVEYITTLEGSLSYSDTVSRSFWWGRIHHYCRMAGSKSSPLIWVDFYRS